MKPKCRKQAISTSVRFSFAFFTDDEGYRDITPIICMNGPPRDHSNHVSTIFVCCSRKADRHVLVGYKELQTNSR